MFSVATPPYGIYTKILDSSPPKSHSRTRPSVTFNSPHKSPLKQGKE